MDTGGKNLTEFQIKDSASPRDVGLWIQGILLANPDRLFELSRESKLNYFRCVLIPMVDEDGREVA